MNNSTNNTDENNNYYEYDDGKTSKFWRITTQGKEVIVHYGRLGTDGQTRARTFDDETEVDKHLKSMIKEKIKKGYVKSTKK